MMALIKEPYGLVYNTDGSLCTTVRDDDIPFPGVRSFAVEEATTNYVDVYDYSTRIHRGDVAIEQITYRSQKALKVTVSGTDPYIRLGFNTTQTVAAGDIYTGSVYVESNEVEITNTRDKDCCIYFATSNFGGFSRYYHTWTMNNNRLITILEFPDDEEESYSNFKMCVYFYQPGVYYVYNPQLEKKPFATSYVDGSRPNGRIVFEDMQEIEYDNFVFTCWANYRSVSPGWQFVTTIFTPLDTTSEANHYSIRRNSNGYVYLQIISSDLGSSAIGQTKLTEGWHFFLIAVHDGSTDFWIDDTKYTSSIWVMNSKDKKIYLGSWCSGSFQFQWQNTIANVFVGKYKKPDGAVIWTDDYIREVYEAKMPFAVQNQLSIY